GCPLGCGVGHFDGDVVAGAAFGQGLDPEGSDTGAGPPAAPSGGRGELRDGRRCSGAIAADADDEAGPATFLEVAVHGVVQVGTLHELTKLAGELAPVGDQSWGIERAGAG